MHPVFRQLLKSRQRPKKAKRVTSNREQQDQKTYGPIADLLDSSVEVSLRAEQEVNEYFHGDNDFPF